MSGGTPASHCMWAVGHLSQRPPSGHIARTCTYNGTWSFHKFYIQTWNKAHKLHITSDRYPPSRVQLLPKLIHQVFPSSLKVT